MHIKCVSTIQPGTCWPVYGVFVFLIFIISLIKTTLGVKKEQPRTKTSLAENMWNQMGSQCLLALIGSKVLVMMNSLQNIAILGAQGLIMLMRSKYLTKMARPQNTVLRPGQLSTWTSQLYVYSSKGKLIPGNIRNSVM